MPASIEHAERVLAFQGSTADFAGLINKIAEGLRAVPKDSRPATLTIVRMAIVETLRRVEAEQ